MFIYNCRSHSDTAFHTVCTGSKDSFCSSLTKRKTYFACVLPWTDFSRCKGLYKFLSSKILKCSHFSRHCPWIRPELKTLLHQEPISFLRFLMSSLAVDEKVYFLTPTNGCGFLNRKWIFLYQTFWLKSEQDITNKAIFKLQANGMHFWRQYRLPLLERWFLEGPLDDTVEGSTLNPSSAQCLGKRKNTIKVWNSRCEH